MKWPQLGREYAAVKAALSVSGCENPACAQPEVAGAKLVLHHFRRRGRGKHGLDPSQIPRKHDGPESRARKALRAAFRATLPVCPKCHRQLEGRDVPFEVALRWVEGYEVNAARTL